MSVNWVMITPSGTDFIKLPNERTLFTSPARTSISIASPNTFPGASPFARKCDNGIVFLTNQRIIYLPTPPAQKTLQSFSAPLLALQDSYVRAPFFGANYWVAMVRPVPGGNIPPALAQVEVKLTFRDGGAFDFHTRVEEVKERFAQVVRVAREEGGGAAAASARDAGLGAVDFSRVHLEQLPAYEARSGGADSGADANQTGTESRAASVASAQPSGQGAAATSTQGGITREEVGSAAPNPISSHDGLSLPVSAPVIERERTSEPPNEPPPGYEEAQAQAVVVDLYERLRREAEQNHES